ncbi:transcriptional regulator [Methanoculleus sp. FWC-SCC1]|uniref:Transcriptional regulator n=1 Tax=Methanoculleus frigidifontis TaxID=2584085 RepID=A0ABT8MDF2_9EURY|nr:transcriptional regulator [Methanoculleus sp. FWC-SCC1]MDN7025973.1 transcriptional regulator [Methanoculleus sp. FWC-SCC1]
MKLPCQVIVWDVLPAIRAAIALELIRCGASQAEAARRLEMAPSAISQYRSKKRGYRIVFDEDVTALIRDLAGDLYADRVDDLAARICAICRRLQTEQDVCGSCGGKS